MSNRAARLEKWLERRGWRPRDSHLRGLARVVSFLGRDVVLLVSGLVIVLSAYFFVELAENVREGDTQKLDDWLVRALRRPDDPATPLGPRWLREAAIDVTALGGVAVCLLVLLAVVGFLLLQRLHVDACLVVVASAGGVLLNHLLKSYFARERPSSVPHLREVASLSFPSGHAMLAAVVYLTLGALLVPILKDRRSQLYCLGVAMVLTLLIGASRVYLGVHYPTDVLAGWAVGLAWALVCCMTARWWKRRLDPRPPPGGPPLPARSPAAGEPA